MLAETLQAEMKAMIGREVTIEDVQDLVAHGMDENKAKTWLELAGLKD